MKFYEMFELYITLCHARWRVRGRNLRDGLEGALAWETSQGDTRATATRASTFVLAFSFISLGNVGESWGTHKTSRGPSTLTLENDWKTWETIGEPQYLWILGEPWRSLGNQQDRGNLRVVLGAMGNPQDLHWTLHRMEPQVGNLGEP